MISGSNGPESGSSYSADSPEGRAVALREARRIYTERPEDAVAEAMRIHHIARLRGESGLSARALALQGLLCVHRGDLRGGASLAAVAAVKADRSEDLEAQAEVATLRAMLAFLSGAYAESVSEARSALGFADAAGDDAIRLFVRQTTRPVLGGIRSGDEREQLDLAMRLAGGDRRELAICHNDLATLMTENGDLPAAEREIARAFALLDGLEDANFVLAAAFITRAEIRLAAGHPQAALADGRNGMELLALTANPNPYLMSAAVRTEVETLVELGAVDDARARGERTLEILGERLPQMRSTILSTLADALYRVGRVDEAYASLARASELERQAFRELGEIQLGLERMTIEAREARRQSVELMARNRELAEAHAELERRSRELEQLQLQLQDQAERDWLTGLHNRRFLETRLAELERRAPGEPVSAAVLDIDSFKKINDRFGHSVGDQVLIRVCRLIESLLHRRHTLVRSGGEEFVLLLPDTDVTQATAFCERIRGAVEAADWSGVIPGLQVTISIGLSGTDHPAQIRECIHGADERLYQAKRGGRNRVVSTSGPAPVLPWRSGEDDRHGGGTVRELRSIRGTVRELTPRI